jgi:hypothetical protein
VRPESTALNVTDRIDALAAALRDAGVPAEQAARLLAGAATAALHAVTLDALLDKPAAAAPAGEARAHRPIRLAA